MIEEWRDSRWPGYQVSSLGRVRSRTRLLSTKAQGGGYLATGIYAGGKSKTIKVHIEVARAFLGAPPEGTQVAHADGDRSNARLDNLSYKTKAENEADKLRHGTSLHGERNHQAKLSDQQVAEARRRIAAGEQQKAIAADLGVSPALVCKIHKGATRNGLQSHFAGELT